MFLMGSLGWLIATAAVVSIPVIIHLLHRQRTTPLQWGAMQFLLESPLQMKRRKRVDHWILMVLRMLALAVLAILLARPLWIHGKYNPLGSKLSTDVAVVLDHSLSMGRHNGEKTLFDQGVGVVDRLTQGANGKDALLEGGDTVAVVLAEHTPRILSHPLPARAANEVRDALHQMKPGLSDASIPDAVRTARELLERHGHNLRKTIIVVSDEQSSGWQAEDDAAWRLAVGSSATGAERTLSVHELPLTADTKSSNISVGGIAIEPTLIGVNRPAQIRATVANSGPKESGPLTLRLVVNGKTIDPPQQITNLAGGQSATVRFDYVFTTAGSNWVRVETDVIDALQADNSAVAAANVWQKIPVLIIDGQVTSAGNVKGGKVASGPVSHGNFKSSDFLVAAMQPVEMSREDTALIQPDVVSLSDAQSIKLEDYFVTVVNDCGQLPRALQDKLADYARSGHGVWFILGARTAPNFISKQLRDSGLFTASLNDNAPKNEKVPPSMEIKDASNPMVAMLTAAERNALSGAVTSQWWSIQPSDPDARIVLANTGGDPLIIERPMKNGGLVAIWATSADAQWNNWPFMRNFVPLVNETVNHLASGQTRGMENKILEAGAAIVWSGPGKPAVQAVDVTLPDGTVDGNKRAVLTNNRYEFRYNNAFLPGLYQLRFKPTEVQPQPIFYGVGINSKEQDRNTLSAKDLDRLVSAGYLDKRSKIDADEIPAVIRQQNTGSDIWKWLALFVLANLLVETYMTYRMVGLQNRVDVAGAGVAHPQPV